MEPRLLGEPSHYAAEALTSITYRVLDRKRVAALFTTSPELARKLMVRLVRRSRTVDYKLLNLARRSVEERVAALVLHFFARLHRLELVSDDMFDLPLSQQQIGDIVGAHPIHINRVLRRLSNAGLFNIQNRQVRIHDPSGLRDLACFCTTPRSLGSYR
jgi:CRP/FNR family transcriptional regulator